MTRRGFFGLLGAIGLGRLVPAAYRAPYALWIKQGLVTTTPGKTVTVDIICDGRQMAETMIANLPPLRTPAELVLSEGQQSAVGRLLSTATNRQQARTIFDEFHEQRSRALFDRLAALTPRRPY